jgi:hypothetical protein
MDPISSSFVSSIHHDGVLPTLKSGHSTLAMLPDVPAAARLTAPFAAFKVLPLPLLLDAVGAPSLPAMSSTISSRSAACDSGLLTSHTLDGDGMADVLMH